jgi:hypothetical protein
MRLINTETLELQEFFDSDIPPYAILSHRWEHDEVSYQDLLEGKKKGGAKYKKIRKFCAVALRDHFDWAWVDTCCIDKKSSADLSEAINAMFGWYQRSQMCYVYLSDVMRDWNETEGLPSHWPTFKQSKWFTRGWTLQELIAPRNLIFYDCHWHPIERRHEMLSDITAATGIPSHAFGYLGWSHSSVAQRMSWASQRETSRVEDIAYCLLGLFDVRMPLLYGEGAFAFKRLQEEIIKVSGDETLFVWSAPKKTSHRYLPLLAESPACFADCGEVTTTFDFWRKPYSMTNKGLKLSTSFYSDPHRPGSNYFLTPLNCQLESEDDAMSGENQRKKVSRLALQLEKLEYRGYSIYFRKSWCKMPAEAKEVESTKTIYIFKL